MRRQQTWLLAADRIGASRRDFVAVCIFLNLRWPVADVAEALGLPLDTVNFYARVAKPLLRQSSRPSRIAKVGACHYCGSTSELTHDHVVPRSRGGSSEPGNIVLACRNCNSAKGDLTPEEWLG